MKPEPAGSPRGPAAGRDSSPPASGLTGRDESLPGGGAAGALGQVFILVTLLGMFFIFLGWKVDRIQGGGGTVLAEGVSPEKGEAIFWGKGPRDGTCHTCHQIGNEGSMTRCPNLGASDAAFPGAGQSIMVRAEQRARDRSSATGETYTATDYLVESLANPSAYLVEGFPDRLMPLVYTGQTDLEPDEVMSVIAYLQSLEGEVDPEAIGASMSRFGQAILRKDGGAAASGAPGGPPLPAPEWSVLRPDDLSAYLELPLQDREGFLEETLDEADREDLADIREEWADEGRDVYEEIKCWSCHKIEGEDFGQIEPGKVGPELTSIGAVQTEAYLVESVVNPNAIIVPPLEEHKEGDLSKMPDFTGAITLHELVKLVEYLKSLKGAKEEE